MTKQNFYGGHHVLVTPSGSFVALLKIGKSDSNTDGRVRAAQKGAQLHWIRVEDDPIKALETKYSSDVEIHAKLDKMNRLHQRLSDVKCNLGFEKPWTGGMTLTENRVFCENGVPKLFDTQEEAIVGAESLLQECLNELLEPSNNPTRISLANGTGIRKAIYDEVYRKLPNIVSDEDIVFGKCPRFHLDAGTGSGKSCTALMSIVDTAKRKGSPMTALWMTSIPKEIDQIQADILKFEELYDKFVIVKKEGKGFRIIDPISDAYSCVVKNLQGSSKDQFIRCIRNALGRGKNVLCAISIHSAKSDTKGWDKALELIHTVRPFGFIISDESEHAQQTDKHVSWVRTLRDSGIFPDDAIYFTMSATDAIRSNSTKAENLVSFSSEEHRKEFVAEGIMPPLRLVVSEQLMRDEMKNLLGNRFDNQVWTQDLTKLSPDELSGLVKLLTSNPRVNRKDIFGRLSISDSVIPQGTGGLNYLAYVTEVAEAEYILKCHGDAQIEQGFRIVKTNDTVFVSLAGTTGIIDRNNKITRLLNKYEKETVVLVSCGAIARGSNIHGLDSVIFFKASSSWVSFKQRSGRLDRMRSNNDPRRGKPKMVIFPFMSQAMDVIVQTSIGHALKVKKINPLEQRSLTEIAKESIRNQYLQGITHTAAGDLLDQELRYIVEKLVDHVKITERIVERSHKFDSNTFNASQLRTFIGLPGSKINKSSIKLENISIDGATDGTDLDLMKKSRKPSKPAGNEAKLIERAEDLLSCAKRELLVRCLYSSLDGNDRAIAAITSIYDLESHLEDMSSWPMDHCDTTLTHTETKSVLYTYPEQVIYVLRAWEQTSPEEVSEFFACISDEDVIRNSRLPKSTGTHFETNQILSKEIFEWYDSNYYEDPACGTGNNLVSALKKFMEEGMDEISALKMIRGNDTCPLSVLEARMRLFYATDAQTPEIWHIVKNQITRYNTLSITTRRNHMYNILTNPPYNGPSGHPRAPKFVKSALDNPEVHIVAMIIPTHWHLSEDTGKNKRYAGIRQKLWERGTTIVSTDVNEHFRGVGEDIGYFISIPSETKKWIIDGVEYLVENPFELLKSKTKRVWEGVRDKIIASPWERIPLACSDEEVGKSVSSLNNEGKGVRTYYSRKQWVSGKKHCIGTVPSDYASPKVIFSRSGWSSSNLVEYCFADVNISSGAWSSHYTTDTMDEAENLLSYVRDSKLFRYMLSHRPNECKDPHMDDWTRTRGKRPSDFLPLLPLDKPYTDEDLYELFNITDEEIEEIEKWTK